MDFGLSEEQRGLEDTLRRLLEEKLPPERVRELMVTESGLDASLWEDLVRLGLPGILIPEKFGGAGGGFSTRLSARSLWPGLRRRRRFWPRP